ncbi:aldo/keto reductase [Mucilaginibacter robiniae]|uniref:Aldo/keto reductase n=1 Tax=Mucilaginibacter robiniae TaxID=2728022 RepID=A0A7L5E1F4_9SPHI|nr:aldo/keto reductase [Mucilaginibacter robiniae]QJD96338.1 aldo/keto reductase [Mucilaginibacter robiniae]
MEFVRFGNTGMTVSRICLGTMTYGTPTERWPWALNEEQSRPFIQKALELGINFFDTADVYTAGASEEVVGRALKDFAKRDEVVLATKVYNPMGPGPNDKGLSRKHIMSAIDASLKRLGTDYVDLYQIHRWDYDTPIEETMEALHDVVKAGKARYIGASSMYSWQFAQAQYTADLHGWTRFVSMQPHYNLIYREEEREMIPFCQDQKIAIIPWSPLARGLLTGKRSKERNETERAKTDAFGKSLYGQDSDFDIVNRVSEIAEQRGLPNAQIALAWMLSKPYITSPIVGASKPGHLEDAVAAVSVKLSDEEVKQLEELYQPHPVLGFQ